MSAAPEPHVLVLDTGGTIGMVETPRGYAPGRGSLPRLVETLPQLHQRGAPLYTTPPYQRGRSVRYDVVQLEPLLDSSNLELSHWARFATELGSHMEHYDGFVVLHGTDTMAYTASALSFMLEGLKKPVILTGSQIPLVQLRNDGLDNLLGAIGIAGHYAVPEVCIYFHHELLRGNRAQKHDARSLDAFASPNFPRLGRIGIDVEIRSDLVLPPDPQPFHVETRLSPHVAALRVYPGMPTEILSNFVRAPLEGLVLESYGAGNVPDGRTDLLDALSEATARGVVVVNVSQCPRGTVTDAYAAGRALSERGVVPGADLTAEAALTKLAYVLGKRLPYAESVAMMRRPLRGEMSAPATA